MAKPKISGFTVVRNAIQMGYPVVESIRSILPIVDEFVVGVGQSDDKTKDLLARLKDPKIKIFNAHWDTQRTKGGLILSEKTNEALDRCLNDWCFYLQADEVVHEDDLPMIVENIEKAQSEPRVQAILFKYIHFYGSYKTVATSRNWYRNEVRIVRKNSGIRSFNDAQGFRVAGEKPHVISSGARIFHYGWVKPPPVMGEKSKLLNRWWHGNKRDNEFENFAYTRQYGLKQYEGLHPEVMRELVESQSWNFDHRRRWTDWKLKDLNLLGSDLIEKIFQYRIGEYRPYRLLKNS